MVVYLIIPLVSQRTQSNGWVTDKKSSGNDVEWISHGLIKVVTWHFPWGNQKKQPKLYQDWGSLKYKSGVLVAHQTASQVTKLNKWKTIIMTKWLY